MRACDIEEGKYYVDNKGGFWRVTGFSGMRGIRTRVLLEYVNADSRGSADLAVFATAMLREARKPVKVDVEPCGHPVIDGDREVPCGNAASAYHRPTTTWLCHDHLTGMPEDNEKAMQ